MATETLLGRVLFAIILYFLGSWIFNIILNPLRTYPGPLICAASRLPRSIAIATGQEVRWNQRLHARYGEVVRVGPTELSFISAQAWTDIYGHRPGRPQNIKDPKFFSNGVSAEVGTPSLIEISDGKEHSRLRKLFSSAFSESALKRQEPMFRKYVDLLIDLIGKHLDTEGCSSKMASFDMVKLFNFTTFDIMGDLAFGEPLDLLAKTTYSPWVKSIFDNIKGATYMRLFEYYPPLSTIVKGLMPKSIRDLKDAHDKFTSDRVDRRLKMNDVGRHDILSLVLPYSERRPLTRNEMYANASLFMLAGSETTATCLSGVIYHILINRKLFETLAAEVRETFSAVEDICMDTIARLQYLNAVIEEGLRMYPPVPTGIPRLSPPEGISVCGKRIPGGTSMSVSHYTAYHSPTNFTFPDTFAPERWLSDPAFAEDNKAALQPFSIGPWNCLGQGMAYHEMRLILALLVWHYDMTLCEESKNWIQQEVYTLWLKGPLMVTVRRK